MLRWQQVKLSNKKRFFSKLLVSSCVAHGLFCFALFFIYSSGQTVINVSTAASEAIVKFVGLSQQPAQTAHKAKTGIAKVTKKVVKPAQKKAVIPVKKKPQPVKKVVPKKPVKKEVTPQKVQKGVPQKISRKAYDAAETEIAVHEAIAQVWAPPAGMDETLMCHVTLTVGWDGKVLKTDIEKTTGVVVYDIAVEQALDALTVPRQAWGKTIRVAFKP